MHPIYNNRNCVSSVFLSELLRSGFDRNIVRYLIKDVRYIDLFEDVAQKVITAEQAAELMVLRRESNYAVIRFLKDFWQMLVGIYWY